MPTMFWVLHKELLFCSVYLATLIGGAGVLVEVCVCVCAALYWTNFQVSFWEVLFFVLEKKKEKLGRTISYGASQVAQW